MQIPNKSQILISNDQNGFEILNFGFWNLFEIWDLSFGFFFKHQITNKNSTSKSQ